ncbi:hypothetical protein BV509_00880 [Rhodovulum sulfidophilum]|uniref:AlpA family transcriptional regulator n=1 Tax=Rhodovulum visakhapatnamense TaxID=364297 RepID=A0ABS1RFI6_9RHOB|nr:hypothetical protein [Rhodovulum visakhapatnamense]MBL3569890.1 hypothetical protein [Rhodovulum visakhapatnamense]MBL3578417.1 hypothetical protein [Rhodovulum visakhapatnamense]OLS43043.1 hypothetical protein BV509_00880 [Rhodovulum sulfidophilum]
MAKVFLTADEVATQLGLASRAAFLRQRPRLEADEDFPLPMPQIKRPLLWRADQVAVWIDRQGRPAAEAPAAPPRPAPLRLVGGRDHLMEEACRP